jgi:DNA-directed RNA polymerase subunit RPC12/RpoP
MAMTASGTTNLYEYKCDKCEQTIALPVHSETWRIRVRCPDCMNKLKAAAYKRFLDRVEGHLKRLSKKQ